MEDSKSIIDRWNEDDEEFEFEKPPKGKMAKEEGEIEKLKAEITRNASPIVP